MNKKLIICLSSLIVLMLIVIAAAVYRLYYDVPVEGDKALQDVEAVDSVTTAAPDSGHTVAHKPDSKPARNPKSTQ